MSEEIVACLEGVAPRTRLLMQDLTQADRAAKVIADSIKDEENAILVHLVDAITKGAEVDFDDILKRKISLRARREELVLAADLSSKQAHAVYEVVDEAIGKTDDKINVLNARLKSIVDTRERKKEKKSAGERGMDSILCQLLESGGIMGSPAASWGGGLGSSGGAAGGGGGGAGGRRGGGAHGRSGGSAGTSAASGGDAAGLEGDDGDMVDPHEPVYCICRKVASGRMVGCENEDECGEWFHFECVGLAPETPEKDLDGWICPNCIASGYIRKRR